MSFRANVLRVALLAGLGRAARGDPERSTRPMRVMHDKCGSRRNPVLRSARLIGVALGIMLGGVITADAIADPVIENTCVPAANVPIWCGDGGPATRAGLVHPSSIDLLPDGSLLLFDSGHTAQADLALVRRVSPDGVITRVAGTGEAGSSGDGGPATRARISAQASVAALPDGGFLIAEADQHRVRRVTPTGVISTVAGTGVAGESGDGGFATSARLEAPVSVSATPDGGYLIADGATGRIRRVTPAGVISTLRHFGDPRPLPDALPFQKLRVKALVDGSAILSDGHQIARMTPTGHITPLYSAPSSDVIFAIALGPAGSIIFSTGDSLMSLDADGTVRRIAGHRGFRCRYPDGGPALRFTMGLALGVVSAPDGTTFVADWINSRIRRIAPDGSTTTHAGGAGSKKGGSCGFGAGEEDMATWAAFNVATVRANTRRITVKLVTTLPAHVTVRITHRGTAVARVSRSVSAGTPTIVIRKRLRAGRYRIACSGRGPENLKNSSVPRALRVSR